ncbi:hypothetical protein PVAND_005930 [Polypedilum vanderplanki]|uniref:Uncharacterized protein n=1 Tax=Polypedilum vanderplanki TaxID=319348 RepID=A0A9J6C1M8_POLVA|nr:hypothetical protein PVAND_005930 [Polypedilum vanderplanki]
MYRHKPEHRNNQNDFLAQVKRRQLYQRIKEHEQNPLVERGYLNVHEHFQKLTEEQIKARDNDIAKGYNNAPYSNRPKSSSSSDDHMSEDNVVYNNYVYDNSESETESIFDPDEYTRKTLNDMETKMNAMTNRFVFRVKSEVDETFSKLKLQQKFKDKIKKDPKKDEKAKNLDRGGAGDTIKHQQKNPEEDITFSLLQKKKAQAYKNIEQNIKVLQNVDQLTDKLYKNHLSNLKKKD